MNLVELRETYRRILIQDVMPFWMQNAIDPNGGINSCIGDDGRLLSRDRWGWSQWRTVWVFSALYNRLEPREEWLDAARGICGFLASAGRLPDGHWPLLLDGDGALKRGYESIYTDGFAVYGLVELWRATKERALLDLALDTFTACEKALAADEPPRAFPYPIQPGRLAHGISMIFSLAYHELAEATGDPAVREAAGAHHRMVMENFLRQDRGVVLERIGRDLREIGPPEGTAVVPGHAIESMWFQIHIARARADRGTIRSALDAIRAHIELGWDEEYGGLLLAVDADGRRDVAWGNHDCKLWWPHTEALYATLLAHAECREPWCLEWHERVRDYSFARFPDAEHGEWRQKLDRRGRPIDDVVALPVKDPFHLPRALVLSLECLDGLLRGEKKRPCAGA